MAKQHRPTKYTPELGDLVCSKIATSNRGLSTICADEGMPTRQTVHDWVKENKEFADKYARAREDQADFLAEEILEIADHSDKDTVFVYDKNGKRVPTEDKEWTNRSKLRVDARKWVASKLKPKKYGDKVELSGDKDNPILVQQIIGMKID